MKIETRNVSEGQPKFPCLRGGLGFLTGQSGGEGIYDRLQTPNDEDGLRKTFTLGGGFQLAIWFESSSFEKCFNQRQLTSHLNCIDLTLTFIEMQHGSSCRSMTPRWLPIPHPPTPRKFGLRLISMANRLGPNLRAEGEPNRAKPLSKESGIEAPSNRRHFILNPSPFSLHPSPFSLRS